jgi:hypothetical protein
MVSWKELGGLGEGKEDAMCDGGRHELLVRRRLDLLGLFLFCVGVGEGLVCFGIVVVVKESTVWMITR